MSISASVRYWLPDTPYNLWVRDELADYLHLPRGTKVEVIGGEAVVSPSPSIGHCAIVSDVAQAVAVARVADPPSPWRSLQKTDVNLAEIEDGCVPDLLLVSSDVFRQVARADAPGLLPHQVALAVELTSRWDAVTDRRSTLGYARVGIGHCLLIDRDPRAAQATLFTNPDRDSGTYLHSTSWEFGETIRLPEPFGFEIPTDEWEPWV